MEQRGEWVRNQARRAPRSSLMRHWFERQWRRMSVRRTGAFASARFARTEDDLTTIKYTSRSGRAPVHGHALARLALGEFAKG